MFIFFLFFFYKAPFGQNKVISLQKQITQMSEQVLIYATTFHLKHFHHHQHHHQTEKHNKNTVSRDVLVSPPLSVCVCASTHGES